MKRLMNLLNAAALSAVAVMSLSLTVTAAAQQLDYTVVKSFQAKYDSIKADIRQAKTVQDCAEISADIDELQKKYAPDTTLLNKALYPYDYDAEMRNIRIDLRLARDKLGVMESQFTRITDLESQVRILSSKVDSLSASNGRLMASLDVVMKAMTKNRNMVDSLKDIIGELRRGLRARDAAIFALVDSIFVQYGNRVKGLPEQERATLSGRLARHGVMGEIRSAAEQNLKLLQTTELTGTDLIQMVNEQHKFSSSWEGLAPKLSELYANRNQRMREIKATDMVVSRWGNLADSLMWAGLYTEFKKNDVPVDSFSNADQFVASLGEYFDTQGGNLKAPATERASRLRFFLNNLWIPTINAQWLPMLVNDGILTQNQENVLQNKLMSWKNSSKPSYVLLYIVIILIFLAIVAFFVRKRKSGAGQFPSQD